MAPMQGPKGKLVEGKLPSRHGSAWRVCRVLLDLRKAGEEGGVERQCHAPDAEQDGQGRDEGAQGGEGPHRAR